MTGPSDAAERRRSVSIAGHTGDTEVVMAGLVDEAAVVRSAALAAAQRLDALDRSTLERLATDDEPTVRRTAAELAARHPDVDLLPLLADDDPAVLEVAAWAAGEHEHDRAPVVDRLLELARHEDPLVRESSVAALGAIGTERAVEAIIEAATTDKPAVRRRAVLALAPFDGPEVEAALEHALQDRDWQVRQAAEELT